ncbi:MAG: sulfite exporter TauE/SafE family protein [Alphaproteobacteria bacterium]
MTVMFDGMIPAAVMATFLLAGMVKGVVGLGLPTISLAILTVVIDMPSAMVLLLVPSFATNLWQAAAGGHALALLRRLWPFLLPAFAAVWIGAGASDRIDPSYLSALLGLLLVIYAAVGLAGPRMTLPSGRERWLGPVFGAANGVLTGMTGSFVMPGVMFLQAIGLARDQLVQAMGISFTLSTLALAAALHGNDLISPDQALLSSLALAPALVGMVIGQRIRQGLSEHLFRRLFYAALLALGLYIITGAGGLNL